MGFWCEQVLPRILNSTLSIPAVHRMRERVCAGLSGEVVEIGFGSGLNVPHYPPSVTRVYAVEPSAVATRLARRRVADSPVAVERAGLDGQRLDLPDESVDCALSTFTLCTVPDPRAAASELLRVLKPDGSFHFLEHGRAPDVRVARWQDRWQPLHRRLAGGCDITREPPALLAATGFVVEDLDSYYAELGPKVLGYIYEGVARKAW